MRTRKLYNDLVVYFVYNVLFYTKCLKQFAFIDEIKYLEKRIVYVPREFYRFQFEQLFFK